MPYFYWKGVELTGKMRSGKSFAVDQPALDKLLFRRNIALLSCKPARILSWLHPIRSQHVTAFYEQLSALVGAGVLLPEGLQIVTAQTEHPVLQQQIHELSLRVHGGSSLSDALAAYPQLYSEITIPLIEAGQESGDLSACLDALTEHARSTQAFFRKLRSALAAPVITFGFFLLVVTAMFGFIVPYLAQLVSKTDQGIPGVTTFVLAAGRWFEGWRAFVFVTVVAICTVALYAAYHTKKGKELFSALLIRLPFVGSIYTKRMVMHFFQSLALLLKGGVPLAAAVRILERGVTDQAFKQCIATIGDDIYRGFSLSQALAAHESYFPQDMVSMIEVAQESGTMALLLSNIAITVQHQLEQRLSFLVRFVQPAALLVLGLLVGLLIVGVYVPLITINNVVSF